MQPQSTKQRGVGALLRLLLVLLFLLVVCDKHPVPQSNTASKAQLRLKLKAGEAWRQWTLTEQTITQQVMDTAEAIRQVVGIRGVMEVLGVDSNGVARIRYTYDSITFGQTIGERKVSFNSADSAADSGGRVPPIAAIYQAMVGTAFTMKMLPNGTIAELAGLDSLAKQIVENAATNPVAAAAAPGAMLVGIKEMVSSQALRSNLQRTLAIYPPKPVAPGDTWSNALMLTAGIPLEITTTHTVKGMDSSRVMVDVRSVIAVSNRAGSMAISGVRFRYNMAGTQTGAMEIDRASGWATSSKFHQTLSGFIEVQGVDSSDGIPSKIPMDVSTTITSMIWKK